VPIKKFFIAIFGPLLLLSDACPVNLGKITKKYKKVLPTYLSINKMSDMSISNLSRYISDCTVKLFVTNIVGR
jgi:hypothetical protein